MSPKGIFDNVWRHVRLSQGKGCHWHLVISTKWLTLRNPVLDSVFTYVSLSPRTFICPFPGLFLSTVSALTLVLFFFDPSRKETRAFSLLSHVLVFCTSLPVDLVSSGDRRPHSLRARCPLKAKLQSGFRFFSASEHFPVLHADEPCASGCLVFALSLYLP